MWILWKMRFLKCEFCAKNSFWKCEFCEKWDFQSVNFWINWGFLPQCAKCKTPVRLQYQFQCRTIEDSQKNHRLGLFWDTLYLGPAVGLYSTVYARMCDTKSEITNCALRHSLIFPIRSFHKSRFLSTDNHSSERDPSTHFEEFALFFKSYRSKASRYVPDT